MSLILNPATGRMVKKDGAVGRKLQAGYVRSPRSKRWVKIDGRVGRALVAERAAPSPKASSPSRSKAPSPSRSKAPSPSRNKASPPSLFYGFMGRLGVDKSRVADEFGRLPKNLREAWHNYENDDMKYQTVYAQLTGDARMFMKPQKRGPKTMVVKPPRQFYEYMENKDVPKKRVPEFFGKLPLALRKKWSGIDKAEEAGNEFAYMEVADASDDAIDAML